LCPNLSDKQCSNKNPSRDTFNRVFSARAGEGICYPATTCGRVAGRKGGEKSSEITAIPRLPEQAVDSFRFLRPVSGDSFSKSLFHSDSLKKIYPCARNTRKYAIFAALKKQLTIL
jgi:hypothetical protein